MLRAWAGRHGGRGGGMAVGRTSAKRALRELRATPFKWRSEGRREEIVAALLCLRKG
jgi:hypothetical protein